MQEWPLLLPHLLQEAGQQVPHLQVATIMPRLLILLLHILLMALNSCSFSFCRTGTSWTRCLSLERLGSSLVAEGRIQEQEEERAGGEQEEEEEEGAGGEQMDDGEGWRMFWRMVEGEGSSSDEEVDEDSSDEEELDEEDSSDEEEHEM